MYADELLIVASCVADLQKMIAIVSQELLTLDMRTNTKKSTCIKTGPWFNITTSPIILCDKQLFSYNYGGKKVSCDHHPANAKFFGSTNLILSKIGIKSLLPLSLSLLFAKTVPILLYSMEAVSMSEHDTTNFSNVFNSMFLKLFGTFNKMIIEKCQYYCGYLPFSYTLAIRKIIFLNNIRLGPESTSQFLLCYVGNAAFEQLLADFDINELMYTSRRGVTVHL